MDGKCASCGLKEKCCRQTDGGSPSFCSTKIYAAQLAAADKAYDDSDILRFAYNSSVQERSCYQEDPERPGVFIPQKPRILDIVELCRRQGYHRLGLAFCIGLHKEAHLTAQILEGHGFEVVSVACKVGCVDKSRIGVSAAEKISQDEHESMCNPIGQAAVLNAAQTDFNIVLGLCVGHDSLFFKHSEALCTVFAVKDRLLGHNPLAALYLSDSYYSFVK